MQLAPAVTGLLGAILATTSLASATPAGDVLVVDDAPGPGVDFTVLQAAVDAAGPTDTILVKAGTYLAIDVDGKPLTMVADTGANVIVGGAQVRNTTATEAVVLRGLRIVSSNGTALYLTSCDGPVWIESCTVASSGLPVFTINDGVRVTACADALFADCTITSGGGGIGGGNGLLAQNSQLHLYDTSILGGTLSGGTPGNPGLGLIDSDAFASGCTFRGGLGGDGGLTGPFQQCADGGDGGAGVSLSQTGGGSIPTALDLFDCSLVGGGGGAPGGPACQPGATGPGSQVFGGSLVDLAPTWPARHYSIPSPIRSGDVGALSFTATPGELAWAVFSLGALFSDVPLFTGSLALDAPLIFVYAGQIPAGGTLSVPLNISLPPGVPYALAYEQGLFFSLEDEFVLGTPRAGWILAAGL